MGTPESWDSLGHMRILMEIESQLGHEIDPELAVQIIDVKSVRSALSG
jgi:acyl carrier protein